MAAWLPVSASILAVSGLAASVSSGVDCTHCDAPAPAPTVATAPAEAMTQAPANDKMEKAEVFVLKFHADWCPKCRSLTPVYDAAAKEFSDKPVAFVKLDVTDADKTKASGEKMAQLGLEDVWSSNKGKNGFIMLVDAETKKSVKVLKTGTTKKQASEAITSALAG